MSRRGCVAGAIFPRRSRRGIRSNARLDRRPFEKEDPTPGQGCGAFCQKTASATPGWIEPQMAPIATLLETIKLSCPYFDKVVFRVARPPPAEKIAWLREICATFEVHVGQPIRGSLKKYRLTAVAPNADALRFFADQRGWM